MGLLKLLTSFAPNRVFCAMVLGGIGGIGYTLLIALVFVATSSGTGIGAESNEDVRKFLWFYVIHYRFAAVFAAVCGVILIARFVSQILLMGVAVDAAAAVRLRAYQQILRSPVAELERLGNAKLLAALTSDVQRITSGAAVVPALLVSIVTLGATFIYLYILSADACRFTVEAMVVGIATYQAPLLLSRGYFERGRRAIDALFESINGLLLGSKELKLGRELRTRYFREVLLKNEMDVSTNFKRGSALVIGAGTYGDLAGFFVIGALAFVFATRHAITSQEVIGVIMVVMYAMGPITTILNSLPQLVVATAALRSMRQLLESLKPEMTNNRSEIEREWSAVRLTNVVFRYSDPERTFQLGPISVDVRRGEITFIAGGNGSGKSTLGKILSLHYAPVVGEVFFGDTMIAAQTVDSAREQVAAILPDFYLFDHLCGSSVREPDDVIAMANILAEFEMEGVVAFKNGRFSTTSVSSGQRKRLALITALLERRQLYVFDEWAADQEPKFKDVFYTRTLKALRDLGKAIVVITHDERYFHVADKVLLLEDGKLSRTVVRREAMLTAESSMV